MERVGLKLHPETWGMGSKRRMTLLTLCALATLGPGVAARGKGVPRREGFGRTEGGQAVEL